MTKLRTLSAAVEQASGNAKAAAAAKAKASAGGTNTILRAISRPMQTYAALTSYRIRRGGKLVPLKPHTVHVTIGVALAPSGNTEKPRFLPPSVCLRSLTAASGSSSSPPGPPDGGRDDVVAEGDVMEFLFNV